MLYLCDLKLFVYVHVLKIFKKAFFVMLFGVSKGLKIGNLTFKMP